MSLNMIRPSNSAFRLSIIGLGYVGLPLAVAFSSKVRVIGFDINTRKVESYRNGIDPTREVGAKSVKESNIVFTSDPIRLKDANFHIVAVPTPVREDKTPDLAPIESASLLLGRNLSRGSIVVYESTVYPGVTEEVCIPLLETESGLKCGVDFKVGYSPERINPGDKEHRLENIIKVVSGMDKETLDIVAETYELVVKAGVHRASSIRVAEAAKVIENSQRDINIAFVNELSVIFHRMGIDTKEVLEAAGTKWNFLRFTPGLVGGHCIGVDPYYLTYKAERLGYHSQVILAGRRINDGMGKYIAENVVKKLISKNRPVQGAKVAILGLTFKENCPDIRNTKVIDIYRELEEYGIYPQVVDPEADPTDAFEEYGIQLTNLEAIEGMDVVVLAVAHDAFRALSLDQIATLFAPTQTPIFFDVKGVCPIKELTDRGFLYWRL